jgi:1-acyl-sn-glycerol-3-phosphate acyltransferase
VTDTSTGAGKLQDRTRKVLGPIGRRLWHFTLEGYDGLPVDGPAILCPNHISFLDSAFLMMTVPRRISFVGKAEYLDDWKTKHLFPALGMIPIDRSGGKASMAALDAAEAVLRRGELFGIFPEGTRSRDGYLYKGHTGAARLAFKVNCPVFPVGVIGTDAIQPPDAKLPKLRRPCTIRIGRPVHPDRFRRAGRDDRLGYRQLIDEVMFEIRELTGQEYRDVYATKRAEALPTETATMTAVGEATANASPVLVQ